MKICSGSSKEKKNNEKEQKHEKFGYISLVVENKLKSRFYMLWAVSCFVDEFEAISVCVYASVYINFRVWAYFGELILFGESSILLFQITLLPRDEDDLPKSVNNPK